MKIESRTERNITKGQSVAICAIAYAAAAVIGIVFAGNFWWGSRHPLVLAGVADITATVMIFIFSVSLDNSSMYDPYWSVAPIFIAFYCAFFSGAGTDILSRKMLVLFFILVWGIRLTLNFITHWQGLSQEDWRYADFRKTSGKAYWLVSFLGIHFFPTAIVFLGCLSLLPILLSGTNLFSWLDVLAVLVTGTAITVETAADVQLRRFKYSGSADNSVFSGGLWAYSRHPNYLGEIMFWWGLYLFGLAADPQYWWTIAGPLCITLMFRFISIPMMERHLIKRRPSFTERQMRVSPLLPWFPKK